MCHALGENGCPRSFSRSKDVSPPLVRRLMSGDLEGKVDLGGVCRQEPDSLGERDVGGKALSIRGKVGELAELQLLPGIGKEPLEAVFAQRIEAAPSFLRIIRRRFDDVKRTFPWFEIETYGQLRSRV